MGLAVTEEHLDLQRVVRSFLERHGGRKAARATLTGDSSVPSFWPELADLGWLGLHIPEDFGGSEFSALELALVAEELGRECVPGHFLTVTAAAHAIAVAGTNEQRSAWLPELVNGQTCGMSLWGSVVQDHNSLVGTATPTLCADGSELLAIAVGDDLVLVDTSIPGVRIVNRENLDPTQPCADVALDGVKIAQSSVISGGAVHARQLLELLAAASATGGAAACREMATAYAKDRVAFGRPIGQFQAVKHHCANMLMDELLSVSAVWDAARAAPDEARRELAYKAAVAVSVPAFQRCAKLNIQVHGGIGFTWEHDAHMYLRRAGALAALVGPLDSVCADVSRLGVDPASRTSTIELPPEAKPFVSATREFVADYWAARPERRHELIVDQGYLHPHWPKPWGRGAGPIEQIVIDRELADVPRYDPLGPTMWTLPIVLPTVMLHGTDDQKRRWIRPTMLGELTWCQLFSEPGAGSDLASLTTRAERVDGGWLVTGQKVWTSSANQAGHGFALVRTDASAPKHKGISCMAIDMHAPGVTVRPLREICEAAGFNEVFLDEVYVPDADVVGDVNRGWAVARTTLDFERVSLGEQGWTVGMQWQEIEHRVEELESGGAALVDVGRIVAEGIAARALSLRVAARAVAGAEPGVEGSVTKLAIALQAQAVADLGLRLLGDRGVFADEESAVLADFFLQARLSTIAGGTSEILRNVIAERALGLPRDPLPQDRGGEAGR